MSDRTKTTHSERLKFLPYGHQSVVDHDIDAVCEVLRSDWLTQGPTIEQFENALAQQIGAGHVVACSSGTAALHLAMLALNIGTGDRVLTSPIAFLSDANCARFVGADVEFADVDLRTANMSEDAVAAALAADKDKQIKVIIPVHFAGHPAALPVIHELAETHGASVVDDACHALGGGYEHEGKMIRLGGSPHARMTVFSFHPVKHVATGEGGAVATNDLQLAETLRRFRNHGMTKTHFKQPDMAYDKDGGVNPWYYEMLSFGFNYRLTDIQAALGISQLTRLEKSVQRRREIARNYRDLIAGQFPDGSVVPLDEQTGCHHAYHLFVVQIDFDQFRVSRAAVMNRLRQMKIGTQVHYIPIHLQPYYRGHAGTGPGDLPNAEAYYAKALSLPMYPELTSSDIERVVDSLARALQPDM
jgi:UDP-4-amino-4,6-dideoxy-N-acetyl-beta-L-altrosamine transaminase